MSWNNGVSLGQGYLLVWPMEDGGVFRKPVWKQKVSSIQPNVPCNVDFTGYSQFLWDSNPKEATMFSLKGTVNSICNKETLVHPFTGYGR